MNTFFKLFFGSMLLLIGVGFVVSGLYLLLHDTTWNAATICLLFTCFGLLVAITGYDLARGRSIKDDLFFLFFN
jgi:hypothetical protein